MIERQKPRSRTLTVIAQDPSVIGENGKILLAEVEIPAENLGPGPWGYRLQVVDYDVTNRRNYIPAEIRLGEDVFAGDLDDVDLLENPHFHCQNVYALVMRTLARFEFALGRRVDWGFYGHHLNLMPHAFSDANAFYSPEDHALMFGYFEGASGKTIYTCLSHDIVVHETTHALLDGLRERFTDPSSPDQAAFHEGFSDVVALLSVFSLKNVVEHLIDLANQKAKPRKKKGSRLIHRSILTVEQLRKSSLLGLAEEVGVEISAVRSDVLRRSVELEPKPDWYESKGEFTESHRRGEILVAAVMNGFVKAWHERLENLGEITDGFLSRDRVVEEGVEIADTLLTIVIRALDFTPPVHLKFGDFLSALITGDLEVRPDDSRYRLREKLVASFRDYGIDPESKHESGAWSPPKEELHYERTHYEGMRSNPHEIFRFVWENRQALQIDERAYSRVISVRPSLRIGPDGFALSEVVAECLQTVRLTAGEVKELGIEVPSDMPEDFKLKLNGGSALIFDEYGRLKHNIHNRVLNKTRQAKRLQYLWSNGYLNQTMPPSFAELHRRRADGTRTRNPEDW